MDNDSQICQTFSVSKLKNLQKHVFYAVEITVLEVADNYNNVATGMMQKLCLSKGITESLFHTLQIEFSDLHRHVTDDSVFDCDIVYVFFLF